MLIKIIFLFLGCMLSNVVIAFICNLKEDVEVKDEYIGKAAFVEFIALIFFGLIYVICDMRVESLMEHEKQKIRNEVYDEILGDTTTKTFSPTQNKETSK